MSDKPHSGKSPYQRGNASARSRGPLLVITAVILLVAALAWTVVYTRGITNAEPVRSAVDPGVNATQPETPATR